MIERLPKRPGAMEDYLRWKASRDQGCPTAKPTKPKGSTPHQKILPEKTNAQLVSSLQRSDTENQQLLERISQLEDQQ